MNVIDKKPVPIYEVECPECKSRIEYVKSEVNTCHITCPVCGVSIWADTSSPVRMGDEFNAHKTPVGMRLDAGIFD